MALPSVLAELGVVPRRAFAKAGVSVRLFANPENFIAYDALGRLFSACVELTGCGHFGLLVGARATLGSFGAIGQLMRHSLTVGEALRELLLHLYLHDRIAVPVLSRHEPSTVLLGYSATTRDMRAVAQLYDAAIAAAFKLLRELCGPSWKPSEVRFAHRPLSGASTYRRVFGAPVRFDAEVSGLVFPSACLERRIDRADPDERDRVRRAIEEAEAADSMSFAQQVERVLHQMMLGGRLSSADVAGLFAISERTVRLRLQAEGTSLQKLLDGARFALARQLMENTRLPLSEVAAGALFGSARVLPGISQVGRVEPETVVPPRMPCRIPPEGGSAWLRQ